MPQFSTRVLFGFLVMLVLGSSVQAAQPSLGERLLPNTTKGALLVTNVEHLNKQWDQTQVGQLMNEPIMQPFVKDMRRQLQERFARLRERLGLTLDDLRGVPSGELDIAVIQPAKDRAAVAMLVDVAGHLPQAHELLKKVAANLAAQGGKKTPYSVGGVSLLLFDVPKTDEYPAGRIVYFLDTEDSLLGAADDVDVIKDILQRKAAQAAQGSSLGDVTAFQRVMARCEQHTGRLDAQIRWFIEPLGYSQAMRILTPEEKRNQKSMVDVFREQGFDAVQGVGGHIDLKATFQDNPFEILHRTAIYAPGPYRETPDPRKKKKNSLEPGASNPYKGIVPMKVLTFPNSRDFSLPPFIPNDVAKCTMFNWDLLAAFDNCPPLIDEIYGEGETGIWQDILDGFEDKDGPQISLRSELIAHLDHQVTVISRYLPKITTTSERLLFAVKIKPGGSKAVSAGLRKWFENDPTIKHRKFGNLDIWETVEPARTTTPNPLDVNLPPKYTPGRKNSRKQRAQGTSDDALFPHRSVMVYQDYLLIASHFNFLINVLEQAKTPDPLSDSMDFRLVNSKLTAIGAGDDCLRAFSRTDEEFRPTYELIKMGKMPEAETMFARMINGLFGKQKRGTVRKQEIDGKEMPDYQVVRRSLGPAGTYGRTERDGWFIVGFMLKK